MAATRTSTLLVVHHTVSPATEAMLAAVRDGTRADGIEQIATRFVPALSATASDVLAADGYLLLTPANIGYMSGALKHFFDQIYYPCRDATAGRGYCLAVHGNADTEGARRAVASITTGLGWRRVAGDVLVTGTPGQSDLAACRELGATAAAHLLDDTD